MEFLLNPTTLAELMALITALLMLTGKKAGWWRSFIFFLLLTLSVETAVHYIPLFHNNRYIVYGIFMPVQAAFYTLFLSKFLPPGLPRQLLFAGLVVFLLIYTYDILHASFSKDYYGTLARKTLSVYIVLFCCIYYQQLVLNTEMIQPLREPAFWIVTGIFFDYFVTFVIFQLRDRLLLLPDKGVHIVTILLGALNWILYGCWSIAFIWRKIRLR